MININRDKALAALDVAATLGFAIGGGFCLGKGDAGNQGWFWAAAPFLLSAWWIGVLTVKKLFALITKTQAQQAATPPAA